MSAKMKEEPLRKKKEVAERGGGREVCNNFLQLHALQRLSAFLSESVSFRVNSTDEAERNRMQAIKCVVVGDGYAINLFFNLTCFKLSDLQLLNYAVVAQLVCDRGMAPGFEFKVIRQSRQSLPQPHTSWVYETPSSSRDTRRRERLFCGWWDRHPLPFLDGAPTVRWLCGRV